MIKIKDNIYWAGYIDWDLRIFHGYSTPYGSTYNAYLILDDSPTLIDTVKHYGFEQMLKEIKEIIDPSKIKYIVSNHTEMDHSGSIGQLLKYCPEAQVICSPKGYEGLKRYFKQEWRFKVVNNLETVNIGKYNLNFVLTPMVHWPDSMATYLKEEQILFSNDAFGQHYASWEKFADQVGIDIVLQEAAKYYANIVMPYGEQVLKVLNTLKSVPLSMILPSHGLLWRRREDIDQIIKCYNQWAQYVSDNRVVIIYDTMWHTTEKLAINLYELLVKENIPVKLINLDKTHISDAITQVMLSKFVLLGSPILNNKILPSIGGFLTYLGGLKPKNRFGFTFGSYGWSKQGFKELEDALTQVGIRLISEGKYFQYLPDEKELLVLKEVVLKIKEFYG